QILSHRPSYINAILIQSRGTAAPTACTECVRRGLTPFPECRRAIAHFSDCCGNCKWRDHGTRCSWDNSSDEESSEEENNDEDADDDDDDDDDESVRSDSSETLLGD
ncbi:hypothetical protein P152DRAFT_412723, partial [Eremomyces bilateralis CBS 781.70]